MLFFDEDNGIVHINETDAGKGNRLVDSIFSEALAIKGDSIYRSLDGINRLMIGTLGLKQNLAEGLALECLLVLILRLE